MSRQLTPRLERAFDFAAGQVRATIERYPDFFPIYTEDGRWKHRGELWTDWCGGFHAGMMWLIAGRTGDPWWRRMAEHYSRLLEPRQHDREVHDLGFIFLNTYLPWYRLTGDEHLREVLITAGRTLALRFNPRGPIPPLVPGAGEPVHRHHDERAADLPRRARGRRPRPVRAGGRALPDDRADARPPRRLDGPRGDLRPGDRRIPPAIDPAGPAPRLDLVARPGLVALRIRHGLRYTGDPADLDVARRNADCFLARCPEGLVPPWDFDVPDGPDRIDDSSAAAIAASGLWDLAALAASGDPAGAGRYRDAALTILDSLCSDRYLAWSTPGWEGVLKHGVYHFHKRLGVDESVMWGDFFFLEAVDKVLRDAEGTGEQRDVQGPIFHR